MGVARRSRTVAGSMNWLQQVQDLWACRAQWGRRGLSTLSEVISTPGEKD